MDFKCEFNECKNIAESRITLWQKEFKICKTCLLNYKNLLLKNTNILKKL